MNLGIIIYSNDTETVANAFKLGIIALKEGDEVKAFLLGKGVEMPEVRQGDLLAIMTAGAYGFSMSSNYNLHRRPPEVLVQGDRYSLVRQRETFDQFFSNQTIPESLL